MWIKKLELKNFQKHSKLELNFTSGVNVIYGHSDAGKSCIRRAIEWVCQNQKIDGIRKANTKLTSVRITLHDDTVIERQRSASINRYILNQGKDDIVFDAVGKTIPQEIKDVLKLEPINIDGEDIYLNSGPQLALPFLFDRSPSFRMKLFNKLTGNDVLDKMFVQFNKDILSIGRELKRENAQLDERQTALADMVIKKEKMELVHDRVAKNMQDLRQLNEKYSKLLELLKLMTEIRVTIVETKRNLEVIKIPDPTVIKQLREKVERLDKLNASEITAERTEETLSKVRGQLSEIKLPTLNYEGINTKIQRLQKLRNVQIDLDNGQEKCYTLTKKLEDIQKCTINCMDQYKELLKSVQLCPTCGQKITDEHLKDMKL